MNLETQSETIAWRQITATLPKKWNDPHEIPIKERESDKNDF